ncbi:hypothetical protein BP6252_13941 [Coleophoma cylindrospora]|uniref:N-acetyltransferase domain-containing protein n=1 Tax=Coleophoma cylindrospora TaxID=1849047 RepID=A0A3D8Q5R8_9HELO|nr:hypothetical protein BP6252_13941 [Coleophoma cylindrospora]
MASETLTPTPGSAVVVKAVPYSHPDAITLVTAQREELAQRYGHPYSELGQAPSDSDVAAFVVAYVYNDTLQREEPIACGGLRAYDYGGAGVGELKRMFVRKDSRGGRLQAGAKVLRELERVARETLGWNRLVLETGALLVEAERFYTKHGYGRIENFGPYVGASNSLCFAKDLS